MLESQIPMGIRKHVICAEERRLLVVQGLLTDMQLDWIHLNQGLIVHLLRGQLPEKLLDSLNRLNQSDYRKINLQKFRLLHDLAKDLEISLDVVPPLVVCLCQVHVAPAPPHLTDLYCFQRSLSSPQLSPNSFGHSDARAPRFWCFSYVEKPHFHSHFGRHFFFDWLRLD